MRRSIRTYIIGLLLLTFFVTGDMLPLAMRLSQTVNHELVAQSEEESPGKNAENKTGFERSEYWINHDTMHLLPLVAALTGIKMIPGNVSAIQKVFLPIPTPPPNAA